MKIPGFTIDTKSIAYELYQLMREDQIEGPALIVGMLSARVMNAFNTRLEHAIPDCYLCKEGVIDNGKALRQRITHEITCRILTLAADDKYCIV